MGYLSSDYLSTMPIRENRTTQHRVSAYLPARGHTMPTGQSALQKRQAFALALRLARGRANITAIPDFQISLRRLPSGVNMESMPSSTEWYLLKSVIPAKAKMTENRASRSSKYDSNQPP